MRVMSALQVTNSDINAVISEDEGSIRGGKLCVRHLDYAALLWVRCRE